MAENKESDFGLLSFTLGLAHLRDAQKPLLERMGDYNTDRDTLARYGNAWMIEIAELVNETPWKKWKQKPIDPDRIRDEMADVLAFLGVWLNILSLWGITVTELALAYDEKNKRNHRRWDGEEAHYGTPDTGYSSADPATVQGVAEVLADMVPIPDTPPHSRQAVVLDEDDDDDDEESPGFGTDLDGGDDGEDPLG